MTRFLHAENFRASRLNDNITAYNTIMRVLSGDGDGEFPDVPFVLTLTSSYTTTALEQSERVKVIEKTVGDEDEFHIIRNFDNPYDILAAGVLNGDHLLGATTLAVTGFSSLVDGNQVSITGHNADYALVSHTPTTITIYPGLIAATLSGNEIIIHIPSSGTGEAKSHPSGRYCYLIDCAAYWKEVQAAINTLETNPFPTDITGDTLTLVKHLQVGPLKSGFTETAGMIRWDSGHFQGYTGFDWVNLDDGGGGGWTPPVGSDGQILVWDTDDWKASILASFLADEIQFLIGSSTWSFTEALTTIPSALQVGDVTAGVVISDFVRAESLSATALNTNLTMTGNQVIIGYDSSGTLVGVPAGFIGAVVDFDLDTPPVSTYLTTFVIGGKPLMLASASDISMYADADITMSALTIDLNNVFEINTDYANTKTYMLFTPQSSYPTSPSNGDIFYHTSNGLQVYQAGSWQSVAFGVFTGWPTPGVEWSTIRYDPTIPGPAWTDALQIKPEGVYITNALQIGPRLPGMDEYEGLIEFRNNDFLGYVKDPDDNLIEVSLTNINPAQRFPIGVENGIVDGTYGIGITTINLTGLTTAVTDGEYVQFEGQTTLYQIVSHLPAFGPTITIVIDPGLVVALVNGTVCSTRAGRTLYYGNDNVWHSTHALRIVDNAEETGDKLARVNRIQIGESGSHGYDGTIKWDGNTKQFQWYDGTQWRYWPISTTLPIPTEIGMFIIAAELTPGVFSWVADNSILIIDDEFNSTLDIRAPSLILDDGVSELELRPGLFTIPALETNSAEINVLTISGTGTYAIIDSLYVKNLYVVGGSEPDPIPPTLSGPRLDLLASAVNAYTFSLIPAYSPGAQTISFVVNVQMIGRVNGDYVAGNTVIDLTDLTGEVQNGNRIRFEGDANTYIIQGHVGNPTVQVTIAAPGLYQVLADDTQCYTDDETFATIFTAALDYILFQVPVEMHDLHVTGQGIFEHTITLGDEEGGIVDQPGMLRFNGDFQGCISDGNWVSLTRSLADGDYTSAFGSILWWNGTKWTKNTNVRTTSTGLLRLGADIISSGLAGAIRWTGTDFQGFNGSVWTSFTGYGGAPALPPGTDYEGATLRWDDTGAQWRINPNLISNGVKTEIALVQLGDYAKFTDEGQIDKAGGYGIGATALEVDTFNGPVVDGSEILIVGDPVQHTIISHSPAVGPTTAVVIESPGLTDVVLDNAAITVVDALPIQESVGGMIRYNQNDYEGFIAGVGWASFTGHLSWLPTLEGDPSLREGNLLVYQHGHWVASHDVNCFSSVFRFSQPVFMRKGLELLGVLKAEAIVVGNKMPEGIVNISTSSSSLVVNPNWILPQDYYDIGDTKIYVDQALWTGPIVVGSQIQIGSGTDRYTVTVLTPALGAPATVEFIPGLIEVAYVGYAINVEGEMKMPIPQAGTVIFDSNSKTFWGYDGTTWRALISPIQGSPLANQILRYNSISGYWEPAAVGEDSLVLIEDDELVSLNPIRIQGENGESWTLEPKYTAEGVVDDYAFVFRSHDMDTIIPNHPIWGVDNIWVEFGTAQTTPAQPGPFFKTWVDYNVFKAVTCTTLTASGAIDIGGTLEVSGMTTFNARVTITAQSLFLDQGNLLLRRGYADIAGTVFSKDLDIMQSGYFGTWIRVGYVAGADVPIGAIRYSTPENITRGDWEGWDGQQWVSFTAGFHGQAIWGTAEHGQLVYFNENYEGGKWTPLPSVYVTDDEMSISVPLTLTSEFILDISTEVLKVGAIRFTGADFVASVDGINWISLTAGSVGGLPDGFSFGSTLYWNRQITSSIGSGTIEDDGGHPSGYDAGAFDCYFETTAGDPTGYVLLITGDSTEYYIESASLVSPNLYHIVFAPALQKATALDTTATFYDYVGSWLPTTNVEITWTTTKINNVIQLKDYEEIAEYNLPAEDNGQIRFNQNDYEGYVTGIGWLSFTGMKHWADPADHEGEFMISNGIGWVGSGSNLRFESGYTILKLQGIEIQASSVTLTSGEITTLTSETINVEKKLAFTAQGTPPSAPTDGWLYYDGADLQLYSDGDWKQFLIHDNAFDTKIGLMYNNSANSIKVNEWATVFESAGYIYPQYATRIKELGAKETFYIEAKNLESGTDLTLWKFAASRNNAGTTDELNILHYIQPSITGISFGSLNFATSKWRVGSTDHAVDLRVFGDLTVEQTTSGPLLGGSGYFEQDLEVTNELVVSGDITFTDRMTATSASVTFLLPVDLGSEASVISLVATTFSVATLSSLHAITYNFQTLGYLRIGSYTAVEELIQRKVGDIRYTGAIPAIVVGSQSIGDTEININAYPDEVIDGSVVTFAGDTTSYTIQSHTGDPTTQIVLTPGLVKAITNTQAMRIWLEGDWEGWDGTNWVSFTHGGGGGGGGIHGVAHAGDTVYYDGTTYHWTANSWLQLSASGIECNVDVNLSTLISNDPSGKITFESPIVQNSLTVSGTGITYNGFEQANIVVGTMSAANAIICANIGGISTTQVQTTSLYLYGLNISNIKDSNSSYSTIHGARIYDLLSSTGLVNGLSISAITGELGYGATIGPIKSTAGHCYGVQIATLISETSNTYGVYIDVDLGIGGAHETAYSFFVASGIGHFATDLEVIGIIHTDELTSIGTKLYLNTNTRDYAIEIAANSITIAALSANTYLGYGLVFGGMSIVAISSSSFEYIGLKTGAITKTSVNGGASNYLCGIEIGVVTGNGPASHETTSYGAYLRGVIALDQTDAYGLRIGDVTATGDGTAYAIYTGLGAIHFGGALTIVGGVTVDEMTSSGITLYLSTTTRDNAFMITSHHMTIASPPVPSSGNVSGLVIAAVTGIETGIAYGLYINSVTTGGTNYAIYTYLGTVRFGDALTVVGNITAPELIASTTSLYLSTSTRDNAITIAGTSITIAALTPTASTAYGLIFAGMSISYAGASNFEYIGLRTQAISKLTTTGGASSYICGIEIGTITGAGSVGHGTSTNGLYIRTISALNQTDAYGLRLDDVTATGSGYAYSIYTGLGLVHFGDDTEIIGLLYVSEITSLATTLIFDTSTRANAITIDRNEITIAGVDGAAQAFSILTTDDMLITYAGSGNTTYYGLEIGTLTKTTITGGGTNIIAGLHIKSIDVNGPAGGTTYGNGIYIGTVHAGANASCYGLMIADVTSVTPNNAYAIYTLAGKVYFGDDLTVDGDLTVNGVFNISELTSLLSTLTLHTATRANAVIIGTETITINSPSTTALYTGLAIAASPITYTGTAKLTYAGLSVGAITKNNTEGGVVNVFSGLRIDTLTIQGPALNTTECYGLYVAGIIAGTNVTFARGLHIGDVTCATVGRAYAIHTGLGAVFFGDDLTVDGIVASDSIETPLLTSPSSLFTIETVSRSNAIVLADTDVTINGIALYTAGDAYGLKIGAIGVSTGTAYGLKIANITGSVAAYAIYTGTGSIRFGGATQIVENLTLDGSLLMASVTLAATTTTLNITGTVDITGSLTANSIITDDITLTGASPTLINVAIGKTSASSTTGDVKVIGLQVDQTYGYTTTLIANNAYVTGLEIPEVYGYAIDNTSAATICGINIKKVWNFNAGINTTVYGLKIGDVTAATSGSQAYSIYTEAGKIQFGGNIHLTIGSQSIDFVVSSTPPHIDINGSQIITSRQAAITNATTNYAFTGNWIAEQANVAIAINDLGTKINAILAMLRTHGLITT